MGKKDEAKLTPEDETTKETEQEVTEEAVKEEPTETETEQLARLLKESEERYLRVLAEYDNFRKRTIKEKDAIYPQAQVDTIAKFLPVIDNFDRALEFEPGGEEFAKGIQLINQSFQEVLKHFSVEEIGEVGEKFDPNLHNAVMHIESDEFDKNVISQVFEKGYKIGDRIIRHSTVQTAN